MCYFNLANSRRVVEEKENIQTLKRKSLISMLHLIGWEADAVDLHQSRSGFKQTRWKGQSLHYILPFSGKQTQACARGVFLHFSPWVNVIKLPLFFSYLGHIVSRRPGHSGLWTKCIVEVAWQGAVTQSWGVHLGCDRSKLVSPFVLHS